MRNDSSGAGNHITGTAGTNPVWGAATGFNGTGAYDYSADVGKYAMVTGISAVRTDYDFEDPSYPVTPEAMMNVRFLKPLLKETGEPDITILPE